MSNAARNDATVEEAHTKFCPYRAALPTPNCVATGCMAWRYSWDAADGFEDQKVTGTDWADIEDGDGDEAGANQRIFLSAVLGEETAQRLFGRIVDAEDEGEHEDATEELNEALAAAWEPTSDAWAENNRPEGEGWGLVESGTDQGVRFAVFQRPAMRRGGCGLAGRLS